MSTWNWNSSAISRSSRLRKTSARARSARSDHKLTSHLLGLWDQLGGPAQANGGPPAQYRVDRCRRPVPGRALEPELPLPYGCQRVVSCAAVVLRETPF